MSRYDLAGNPMPDNGAAPPPAVPPPAAATPPPPTYAPGPIPAPAYTPHGPAPAPTVPAPAPAPWRAPVGPSSSPQSILTRGVVQETPAQKVRAYSGLLGTFLLLIALTYAVAAIPAPHIAAPVSYTKHTVQRGGFTYDAPGGWERQRLDEGIMTHVLYKNRKAIVQIDYVPTEVLGTSASQDLDAAHARGLGLVTDELGDVPFQDRPAQPVTTGLGEGRLSEWTVKASLTHLHGCRATVVAPGVEAFMTCLCPERDWATLQPAFLHVIQSAAPLGGPQTPQPSSPPTGGM